MDEASGSSPLGSTPKNRWRSILHNQSSVLVVTFLITVSFSLFVQFTHNTFNTVDAFYHSAQSIAYFTGKEVPYPFFTNFSVYPADIWVGYHYILGFFHYVIPGNSYQALLYESFIFHAILGGIMVCVWLHVSGIWYRRAVPIFQNVLSRLTTLSSHTTPAPPVWIVQFGLFTTLFVFYGDTFFRLALTQRPHILMVIIILLSVLAIMQRKNGYLFLLFFCAPFAYSVSWFVFIPIASVIVGWLMLRNTWLNLKNIMPVLLYSSAGYLTGLTMHPQSLGYIINGLGFGTFAIFQSVLGSFFPGLKDLYIANEMQFNSSSLVIVVLLLILFLSIGIRFILREQSTLEQTDSIFYRFHLGLIVISTILLVCSIFVFRVIEYAIPLGLLVSAPLLLTFGVPLIRFIHSEVIRGVPIYRDLCVRLTAFRTRWSLRLFAIGLLFICAVAQYEPYMHPPIREFDRYQGAAQFLSELTQNTGAVIAPSLHDMYGPLAFYSDFKCRNGICNKYLASGMDNRLMYFFNPALTLDYEKLIGYNVPCIYGKCGFDSFTEAKSFMDNNAIMYIIHDTGINQQKNTMFDTNPYLQKIYTDDRYPTVHVYERIN